MEIGSLKQIPGNLIERNAGTVGEHEHACCFVCCGKAACALDWVSESRVMTRMECGKLVWARQCELGKTER